MGWLAATAIAGLIATALGFLVAPDRVWPNILIAVWYLTALGLGAGFFIASQYVCGAGWSIAIRRIPEAVTTVLPVAGVGGALILLFGLGSLYEWMDDSVVAHDPILSGKAAWLNGPFFRARIVVYFLIWIWMSRALVSNSVRQDSDGDLRHTQNNVRHSVFFIILGVTTSSLASIDLLMSLQPHWVSTVFGFLTLAGMFLSGLAIITLFIVGLRWRGYSEVFTTDHLYDLGRLLLAFSVFWVFLWVSQHLLIWYSSIPEETSYYVIRHRNAWGTLSVLNIALNWAMPFVLLLSGAARRNERIMFCVALTILAGRWLDLYIVVIPPTVGGRPELGLGEIAPMICVIALFFWIVFRSLSRRNPIPIRDPYLVESLSRSDHPSP